MYIVLIMVVIGKSVIFRGHLGLQYCTTVFATATCMFINYVYLAHYLQKPLFTDTDRYVLEIDHISISMFSTTWNCVLCKLYTFQYTPCRQYQQKRFEQTIPIKPNTQTHQKSTDRFFINPCYMRLQTTYTTCVYHLYTLFLSYIYSYIVSTYMRIVVVLSFLKYMQTCSSKSDLVSSHCRHVHRSLIWLVHIADMFIEV